MNKLHGVCMFLVFVLAACGGAPDAVGQVPTVFELPTSTAVPPTTPAPPTLPGTFTPTPTITLTPTPGPTETSTVTPSATITETSTPTGTFTITPTADNQAISSLVELARKVTIVPANFAPTAAVQSGFPAIDTSITTTPCTILPGGGFSLAYTNNPTVAQQLGCPIGNPPITESVSAATQPYEHGFMIWLGRLQPTIYAFYQEGTFQRFDDTFTDGVDPYSGGESPPAGLLEPVRGFGKVWRTYANVKGGLGWASSIETSDQATLQVFERGRMLYLPSRKDILVLLDSDVQGVTGRWLSLPGSF